MWSALFKNGGLTVSKIWSQLAGVILMFTAAKVLTPAEFGVFALASAATMILNQLVGVGSFEYVIREQRSGPVAQTGFWMNMAGAAVMTALGLGVSFTISRFEGGSRLAFMIAVLAPLAFPAGWRAAIEATLVRDGRVGRLGACSLTVETIAFAVGMAALLRGAGVEALLLHKVTQFLTAVPVFTVAARWRPRLQFQRGTAANMARFGAGLFGDRVLGYLQNYGVDLILGIMLNPAAVAIYRLGVRVVVAIGAIIGEQVRMIGWVRLSRARGAGLPVAAEAERLIASVFVVITGPFIGLALCVDLIIAVILGPAWAVSGTVASLLALATVVLVPHLLSEAIFGAVGATRWLAGLRAIMVAILLLFFFLAASRGPVWTAGGQLMASIIDLGIVLYLHKRVAGVRAGAYAGVAMRCLAAASVMAAAVLAVRFGLAAAGLPTAVMLALAVGAGGVAYVGTCIALFGRRLLALTSNLLIRG